MKDLAVIFAGGFGSRMKNYSKKPKQLIKVNGTPIIETIIESLQKSQKVAEILVITGHLASYFDYLPQKYDNLKIFYNEEYQTNSLFKVWTGLKKFLKKNQSWLLIAGDMILYENYFQERIPQNTMAAFFSPNEKKQKMLFYCLNKQKQIIDVELSSEKKGWILGEFSRIDYKIIAEIIKRNSYNSKLKNNLVYENLLEYSKKTKNFLKMHILKREGPSDVDNVADLRKVRKIFANKNIPNE